MVLTWWTVSLPRWFSFLRAAFSRLEGIRSEAGQPQAGIELSNLLGRNGRTTAHLPPEAIIEKPVGAVSDGREGYL